MQSELPKVLVPACGRPLIDYVLDALEATGFARSVVVVGYQADLVRQALAGREQVEFADQTEQLGTGHAVMMCQDALASHEGPVLILTGDSPLVQRESLAELLAEFQRTRPACLLGTLEKEDPTGLGRIVRDAAGNFEAIVEQRDATPEQLAIREVNMSTYLFDAEKLRWALQRLTSDNSQREYYITDAPGILKQAGEQVQALAVLRPCEALSVNTPADLAIVEAAMRDLGYPATDE